MPYPLGQGSALERVHIHTGSTFGGDSLVWLVFGEFILGLIYFTRRREKPCERSEMAVVRPVLGVVLGLSDALAPMRGAPRHALA